VTSFWNPKSKGAESKLAARLRSIAQRSRVDETEGAASRPMERPPRTATFRNAVVILDSGEKVTVVLKDVSANGARLEFFRQVSLPQSFLLREPLMKLECRVRVVWQRAGVAAVTF
jgi:hypothetical protein